MNEIVPVIFWSSIAILGVLCAACFIHAVLWQEQQFKEAEEAKFLEQQAKKAELAKLFNEPEIKETGKKPNHRSINDDWTPPW